MHLGRDPAPVVLDGRARVDVERHPDAGALTGERFVDRVVDDFEHEIMKSALAGVTDVHTRALAHGLKALEDLDVLCAISALCLGRAHRAPKCGFVERAIVPCTG